MSEIWVKSSTGDYPIVIKEDFKDLRPFITELAQDNRQKYRGKIIITDVRIASLYEREMLLLTNRENILKIPAGEKGKTLATYEMVMKELIYRKISRAALIMAIGGGAVLDLAGFIAATYMRGVDILYIPTTTTAMVDASIGGKTAINMENYKNMVGVFRGPKAIYMPLSTLQTLDTVDFSAGIVEAIKHGLIASKSYVDFLLHHEAEIISRDIEVLKTVIFQSIMLKKELVEADERETGQRKLLNFGHSYGHALEALAHDEISHGAAVAVGMLLALEKSCCPEKEKTIRDLQKFFTSLEINIHIRYTKAEIIEKMQHDKKTTDNKIDFIRLEAIGKGAIVSLDFDDL